MWGLGFRVYHFSSLLGFVITKCKVVSNRDPVLASESLTEKP